MAYRIAPRKRGGRRPSLEQEAPSCRSANRSMARCVRAHHPALRRSPTGAELREIATQQASRLPMPRGRASTSTSRPQSKACASQFFGGTSSSAGGALASTELTSSGTSVANSGSRLSRRACRAARFAFARAARCCSFWRLRNEVDPLADNRVLRSSRNWNALRIVPTGRVHRHHHPWNAVHGRTSRKLRPLCAANTPKVKVSRRNRESSCSIWRTRRPSGLPLPDSRALDTCQ